MSNIEFNKDTHKKCNKCQVIKDVDSFSKTTLRKNGKMGRKTSCLDCNKVVTPIRSLTPKKEDIDNYSIERSSDHASHNSSNKPWLTGSSSSPFERTEINQSILEEMKNDNNGALSSVEDNFRINFSDKTLQSSKCEGSNEEKIDIKSSKLTSDPIIIKSEFRNLDDAHAFEDIVYVEKDKIETNTFFTDKTTPAKSTKNVNFEAALIANDETGDASPELIASRKRLIYACQCYPAEAERLKLTPGKVIKMKSLNQIEQELMGFKCHGGFNALTAILRTAVIGLTSIFESVIASTAISKWLFLTHYSEVVEQDAELDPILRELSLEYISSFEKAGLLTPEAKLGMLLVKDGLNTHNYNNRRLKQNVQAKHNAPPTTPQVVVNPQQQTQQSARSEGFKCEGLPSCSSNENIDMQRYVDSINEPIYQQGSQSNPNVGPGYATDIPTFAETKTSSSY